MGDDVGLYCDRFLDLIFEVLPNHTPTPTNNILYAHPTPTSSSLRDSLESQPPVSHDQTTLLTVYIPVVLKLDDLNRGPQRGVEIG